MSLSEKLRNLAHRIDSTDVSESDNANPELALAFWEIWDSIPPEWKKVAKSTRGSRLNSALRRHREPKDLQDAVKQIVWGWADSPDRFLSLVSQTADIGDAPLDRIIHVTGVLDVNVNVDEIRWRILMIVFFHILKHFEHEKIGVTKILLRLKLVSPRYQDICDGNFTAWKLAGSKYSQLAASVSPAGYGVLVYLPSFGHSFWERNYIPGSKDGVITNGLLKDMRELSMKLWNGRTSHDVVRLIVQNFMDKVTSTASSVVIDWAPGVDSCRKKQKRPGAVRVSAIEKRKRARRVRSPRPVRGDDLPTPTCLTNLENSTVAIQSLAQDSTVQNESSAGNSQILNCNQARLPGRESLRSGGSRTHDGSDQGNHQQLTDFSPLLHESESHNDNSFVCAGEPQSSNNGGPQSSQGIRNSVIERGNGPASILRETGLLLPPIASVTTSRPRGDGQSTEVLNPSNTSPSALTAPPQSAGHSPANHSTFHIHVPSNGLSNPPPVGNVTSGTNRQLGGPTPYSETTASPHLFHAATLNETRGQGASGLSQQSIYQRSHQNLAVHQPPAHGYGSERNRLMATFQNALSPMPVEPPTFTSSERIAGGTLSALYPSGGGINNLDMGVSDNQVFTSRSLAAPTGNFAIPNFPANSPSPLEENISTNESLQGRVTPNEANEIAQLDSSLHAGSPRHVGKTFVHATRPATIQESLNVEGGHFQFTGPPQEVFDMEGWYSHPTYEPPLEVFDMEGWYSQSGREVPQEIFNIEEWYPGTL